MKLQNHKFARTLAAAAVATCAVAMLSVGAFAADVAIGEKDPTYGGYGAPAGPAIQGNIMLISADGDVAVRADVGADSYPELPDDCGSRLYFPRNIQRL